VYWYVWQSLVKLIGITPTSVDVSIRKRLKRDTSIFMKSAFLPAFLSLFLYVTISYSFVSAQAIAESSPGIQFVPTASTTLPEIPRNQIHSYHPLQFAAFTDSINGILPALTNIGLFEVTSDGTIIRGIGLTGQSQPLQASFNSIVHSPDGDYAYISTGQSYSPMDCLQGFLPHAGEDGYGVYRFNGEDLTLVGTHSGNLSLFRDPSGLYWGLEPFRASGYEGIFRLYHIRGDSLVAFPEIPFGKSFWFDEEAGALVVGYGATTHEIWEGFWGQRFARWDGSSFETIDTPTLPPPRNLMLPHLRFSTPLHQSIADQRPHHPREWGVPFIDEGPDGSVWMLERVLGVVCVTKEGDENRSASNPMAAHYREYLNMVHGFLENGVLRRQWSGGTEYHALWMNQSPDFYGINDAMLDAHGNPVLTGYLRLPFSGTSEPRPALWHYREADSLLVMVPETQQNRRYMRRYYLSDAGNDHFFMYANAGDWLGGSHEMYLYDGNALHPIDIPDTLVIVTSVGIYPAGPGHWRFHTWNGHRVDLKLPDDDDDEAGFVPVLHQVTHSAENTYGFGILTREGVVWHLEEGGLLTGRDANGQTLLSVPWEVEAPVTAMLQVSGSVLLVATCGEGIIRVHTSSGEMAGISVPDGLSSDCVFTLSPASGGRVLAGTLFGYTVIGDRLTPGGGPMTPLQPVSVPDAHEAEVPSQIRLLPNYPNPFNPDTTIPFQIHEAGIVRITVFDVLGRQVRVLTDGLMPAGQHQVVFRADGLSSGVYMVRLAHQDGSTAVRSVMFVK
jgi:hypothetical protein